MCSVKKDVLKKFYNFYRKTPVLKTLFNKVVALQACNFIKKRQRRCFPVKFAKFLRTPILKNICEGLLLLFFRLGEMHVCLFIDFLIVFLFVFYLFFLFFLLSFCLLLLLQLVCVSILAWFTILRSFIFHGIFL